ncbi:hypothetical protein RFW18_16075 [Metabacillus idriensis]|nr:hypothetical protein [Metabacillus idriensis]MDR0139272.1 hypothetical protein [Metabacillus idriensis]
MNEEEKAGAPLFRLKNSANRPYQLELEGTSEMLSVSRNNVKSLQERLEI